MGVLKSTVAVDLLWKNHVCKNHARITDIGELLPAVADFYYVLIKRASRYNAQLSFGTGWFCSAGHSCA